MASTLSLMHESYLRVSDAGSAGRKDPRSERVVLGAAFGDDQEIVLVRRVVGTKEACARQSVAQGSRGETDRWPKQGRCRGYGPGWWSSAEAWAGSCRWCTRRCSTPGRPWHCTADGHECSRTRCPMCSPGPLRWARECCSQGRTSSRSGTWHVSHYSQWVARGTHTQRPGEGVRAL